MANSAHRRSVIQLYKGAQVANSLHRVLCLLIKLPTIIELLHLGRNYPQGYAFFRERVHRAFMAQSGLRADLEIQTAIRKAEYVKREIEAL